MFKKRTQKPAPRSRNPHIQPQTNKIFSYYNVKRPVEVEDAESGQQTARHSRDETVSKAAKHVFLKRLAALGIFVALGMVLLINARLVPSEAKIVLRGTPEQRLLLQDEKIYKAGVAKIMQSKLENRTKLTFSGKAFSQAMKKQYPEISLANVSLPIIGGQATVYIEPSPVALLFITQDKKAYVLDNEGKIISESISNVPQGAPTVSDQSGIAPKMGMQALPRSDVYAIQVILRQLKEKGIAVESMVLPNNAQRLEVRLQGRPYGVRFNLHDNILQQAGAYIAVQRKLDKDNVQPKEYIDVRVADRVYYK